MKDLRKIARWTIGPVSNSGQEILRESILKFSYIYPEFERILCYNNINEEIVEDLSHICKLYKQESNTVPCKLSDPDENVEEATGCGWKLAPPRIDIESMELFIDNDLIIRKRLPQIDEWIKNSNCFLIAEGLSRVRMYGVFDPFIPEKIHANAGIFGIPSGFDFYKKISDYSLFLEDSLGGYNEQGLTVATIVNTKNYIMIPLSVLHISEDHEGFPKKIPDAIHFVGANRKNWHRGWAFYKNSIKKLII
jgi:hypothetical protein